MLLAPSPALSLEHLAGAPDDVLLKSHLQPAGSGIHDLRSASQAIEAQPPKMRGFYMQYLDSKSQPDSIGTLQAPIGTPRARSYEFLLPAGCVRGGDK